MKFRGNYFAYFLMNTFYFLSLALFSVIISIYLIDLGFYARQVSLVMTAQCILCMIAQPFIGKLCDLSDKRIIGTILFFVSALLSIAFIYMRSLLSIAVIYDITMALFYGFNPIIERISVLSSHNYNAIRIWSTIGYALGTQLFNWFVSYSTSYLTLSIFSLIGIVLVCFFRIPSGKKIVLFE